MRPAPVDELLLKRSRVLQALVFAGLFLLGGRLYFLQVVSHDKFVEAVTQQHVKTLREEAPRGLIRDREGRLLVGNRRSFELVADLDTVRDDEAVAELVSQVTGEPAEAIVKKLEEARKKSRVHRVTLAKDLLFSMVAFVEARREDAPGLLVTSRQVRRYPEGSLAAHVLGFPREISDEELADPVFSGYHVMSDLIGKAGLERSYDRLLSGEPGKRKIVRDVVGRQISSSLEVPPVRGDDLELTLDLDMQRAAEEALAGLRGAVVFLDVRDGSVLAMASAPTFEPSAFVGSISGVRYGQWRDDPANPLLFRPVAGVYPPGSIWKPLVAAAALHAGIRKPEDKSFCGGSVVVHGQRRRCWKEQGHGFIDMEGALIHSCNVYFYLVAKDLGLDPIHDLADAAGVGRLTGIDLPEERSGILPSDSWKRRRVGEKWYPGDTVNLSIGQGFLSLTPIQTAAYSMVLANGGTAWRPHVLRRAFDPVTGEKVFEYAPESTGEVHFDPKTLAFLHRAMTETVDRGTGRRARLPGVPVAGKTGTAQAASEPPEGADSAERALQEREHAWFMGFAPADDPQVAYAVVVEHAGDHGGTVAAPIARRVLEARFLEPEIAEVGMGQ